MEFFKKFLAWLDNRKNFVVLCHLIILLLCAFLLYQTSSLWHNLFNLFITIVKPFFVGFVIAYVFEPFVEKLMTFKIKRSTAIALMMIMLLFVTVLFIGTLVPLLYAKILEMADPLTRGLATVQQLLLEHFQLDISAWVTNATQTVQEWLMDLSFMNTTIGIIGNIINKVGSYTINLILAIYFLADYPRIHHHIAVLAYRIHHHFAYCLKQIDLQLTAYIKAFLLLMIIQTLIFIAIYLAIGHPNWLLLGLLSGVSSIFPFIGPLSINILGVLTFLGMPLWRVIFLIILIFIESSIDSYFITPKVYSSKIQIAPIYVIFSLLSASTLLGPWGIVVAMPLFVIFKTTFQTIKEIHFIKG